MKYRTVWLLICFILAACAQVSPVVNDNHPPTMTIGVDRTYPDDRLIEDRRFAALYLTENSEVRRFDDIGRMVIFLSQHPDEEPVAKWVFDYETAEPIRAEAAFFVASPTLVTPRGSGIIAVADSERANLLARGNGGRVMSWDETGQYLAAVPDIPPMPSTSGGGLGGLMEVER